MFKIAIVILSLVFSASAFWSRCDDIPNAVFPYDVISPSCPVGGTHCIATRGQPLEADAYWRPVAAHNVLSIYVTAYVFGIGLELPPVDDSNIERHVSFDKDNLNVLSVLDACNGTFLPDGSFKGCPTTPGEVHVWRIDITIPTTYPAFQNARVRCMTP
jgi:hypothetical protein